MLRLAVLFLLGNVLPGWSFCLTLYVSPSGLAGNDGLARTQAVTFRKAKHAFRRGLFLGLDGGEISEKRVDLGAGEAKLRHRRIMGDDNAFGERFLQVFQRIAPREIAQARRDRQRALAACADRMAGLAFLRELAPGRQIGPGGGGQNREKEQGSNESHGAIVGQAATGAMRRDVAVSA